MRWCGFIFAKFGSGLASCTCAKAKALLGSNCQ
jgi:hypothetical protein